MKFRFCGDADCPDWLLMQINTLSALTVDQFREICSAVAQSLQGKEMDYTRMKELGKEARLDTNDLKACISGLSFIFRSGTTYGVQSRDLGAELEQLGLEQILTSVLTTVYSECYPGLREAALASMLKFPSPSNIRTEACDGGIKLSFTINPLPTSQQSLQDISVNMTKKQGLLLLEELKHINQRIDKLNGIK